jgi:Zn-dependent protease
MRVAAPRPTWLDLRWQMFGAPFRVHILFWPAAAALGWGWHAGPSTWSYFLIWIVCVFLCLVAHETGHVLAARYLGGRPEAVLYLLGSVTAGLEEITARWKRIVILLTGPLATGLFLLALWGLSKWLETLPAPDPVWGVPVGTALNNLARFNWWWLLLNLIPLWPLDVGRILGELGDSLGKQGRAAVLGVCLFTAAALAWWLGSLLDLYLKTWRSIPLIALENGNPELMTEKKNKLELMVQEYAILLFFSVLFLARVFLALRAEAQPLPGEEPPPAERRS